jgi:hypothetical protein
MTFAEQMVEKIQAALLENPLADSVSIDGTTVSVGDAEAKLRKYEARVAVEQGKRPRLARINLGGH